MAETPASVTTAAGPPIWLPLAHVGTAAVLLLGLLAVLAAGVAGVGGVVVRPAVAHLGLAGVVCVTIAGAATQFLPVWSGRPLFSLRLGIVQLPLLTGGVVGLALGLTLWHPGAIVLGGLSLAAGIWALSLNGLATLAGEPIGEASSAPAWRRFDLTEWHLVGAFLAFALAAVFGVALAVDLWRPFLHDVGLNRVIIVTAHATLAVFGGVLGTVIGALYQLGSTFVGATFDRRDRQLQRVEGLAWPVGVLVLAGGRLLGSAPIARIGAVALAVGVAAFLLVVGRAVWTASGGAPAVVARYRVATVLGGVWIALGTPAWVAAPLSRTTLLGPPVALVALAGFLLFVIVGTLYHVVPFLLWVDRYADRIGHEPVPTTEELYGRTRVDGTLTCLGLLLLGGGAAGVGWAWTGGVVVGTLGVCLAAVTLARTVVVHGTADLVVPSSS